MTGENALPNDRRGFIHGRILSAGRSLITGGSPLSAASAFLTGGRTRTGRAANPCAPGVGGVIPRRCFGSLAEFASQPNVNPDGSINLAGGVALPFGGRGGRGGAAVGPPLAGGGGAAVLGRFGAALVPGSRVTDTDVCLPGMVLGKMEQDGGFLCYNRRDIANKDRKYPRGRRPLMTGGDLNAISRAARVARKMETQKKRLEKLGLLKKPAPRRKQITSGPTAHHHHD